MYDCIIIGGGVIGSNAARCLSHYKASVLVLDKEDDVCVGGASRANSGIVHAGFDCEPNTNKAKYNVRANPMFDKLCEELHVPFFRVGSLVCAMENELEQLKALYEKGITNGVEVQLLNREEILALEPNVSDKIQYALYAKNAGIISPYKFTIACANYAAVNGVEFSFGQKVININEKADDKGVPILEVITEKDVFYAHTVINCAGVGSMRLNMLAGAETYEQEFIRGEYALLDKTEGKSVTRVLFPLPDEKGKGILVAPTADGNVIYGPTSIKTDDPTPITTREGLNLIKNSVSKIYSKPNFKKIIRVYSGIRVVSGTDFIIKKSNLIDGYIFCLGICSPGLSASPAIAEKLVKLVLAFLPLGKKSDIDMISLPNNVVFAQLNDEERRKIVAENPLYGNVVCRCETVTEAEIIEAIHSPIPAKTIDGVKRRIRVGVGRCQGGFCTTRVMEILSRELNVPFSSIKKNGEGSEIVLYRIKEGV